MGRETGIAWCDHTANFWMGCQRVSPGCEHCYAEALVTKRMRLPVWGPPSTTERKRTLSAWRDVPAWDRAAKRDGVRRRLFVSSLADIFEEHPQVAPWRAEALALLERCTSLDVLLLTKRPQNIRAMVPPAWLDAWPAHVWIGTTVEDQKRAEDRIPELLRVPARVRFLSCEPLLEEVDLDPPTCPRCLNRGFQGRPEVLRDLAVVALVGKEKLLTIERLAAQSVSSATATPPRVVWASGISLGSNLPLTSEPWRSIAALGVEPIEARPGRVVLRVSG